MRGQSVVVHLLRPRGAWQGVAGRSHTTHPLPRASLCSPGRRGSVLAAQGAGTPGREDRAGRTLLQAKEPINAARSHVPRGRVASHGP